MIYAFETENEHAATAALLVYAVWRSRDVAAYKITPDVWGQVEGFVKSAAKRSKTIPEFIEFLKPKLKCATLHPRAMEAGIKGPVPLLAMGSGAVLEVAAPEEQREFLVQVMERSDHRAVTTLLYRQTAWVIALVRDRLERERPLESRVAKALAGHGDEEDQG